MDGPTSPLCTSRFAWARLVAVPVRVLGRAPVRSSASASRTGRRTGPRRSPRPHRRAGGSVRFARSSLNPRGWDEGRARAHDDSLADPGLARAGPRPAETGAGLRNSMSPRRDPGAGTGTGPGSACAMRAQRDTVHPGSRHASPARRNPSSLDSREPTWRNASPGDITRTTPPRWGRAGRWCRRRRRSHRSRRRVAPGAARPPPRRRSASAPAAPPDRSPEEP